MEEKVFSNIGLDKYKKELFSALKIRKGPYQLIILNIKSILKNHSKLFSDGLLSIFTKLLAKTGLIWCFVEDFFNYKEKKYDFRTYNVLSDFETHFTVRNCIVRFNPNQQEGVLFKSFYDSIIFCSKDPKEYKFFKDRIREKHIWKDYEWGGGRRSRYNPKGKDPSNFWIRTESHKGKITAYYPLTEFETLERIILSSCSSNDSILLVSDSLNNDTIGKITKKHTIDLINIEYSQKKINSNGFLQKRKEKPYTELKEVNSRQAESIIYYKSSESMNEILDESVKVIVTSPPYWGLRNYDHPNQIGYNETYETYRARLLQIWQECYRVLSPNGTIWVNINKRITDGRYRNIPHDFVIDLVKTNFIPIDIIIWHRPISVPGYGEKNLADRYEVILLFAKSLDYEFSENGIYSSEDYAPSYISQNLNIWKMFRKIGNIGKTIKSMKKDCGLKHTAMFPEELPRRAILIGSNKEDLILDPFLGSGTTLAVAKELGRSGIGYEINPKYRSLIDFRLRNK